MGELAALAGALVWALTTVAMRPISGQALLHASVVRMVVGTALLLAYAWPTGAVARAAAAPLDGWLWLVGSTLSALVAGDSLYFAATARLGVARALPVAASAYPLFSTLGAVLLLGEPATPQLVVGSLLVVAGVGSVAGERVTGVTGVPERIDPGGLGLAVLAATCWAVSGLQLRPALEVLDPIAANVIRFPLGTLAFAGFLAVRGGQWLVGGREWWYAVAAGVGTIAAALLFLGAVSLTGVAKAILLNSTSPVFGALLAAWLLHERLSRRSLVAIAATVAGSMVLFV